MINKFIQKFYFDKYVTEKVKNVLCLINNQRAKFGSILFLIIAFFSTLYNFVIYQKSIEPKLFFLHFKVDIILLVFTIVFLLYVFYNQIKELSEVRNHHRLIHGAISLIIISWGAVKSSLTILSDDNNYYIYLITILITSVIFYFPFVMYLSQIIFSYLLLWLIHLLFDISFKTFFFDLSYIFVFLIISFTISRILFYYKVKFLLKEREISKLKKFINHNGKK
ncbi:MAG: hypothetical protein ACLFVR_08915 [Thiohalospira sp.]